MSLTKSPAQGNPIKSADTEYKTDAKVVVKVAAEGGAEGNAHLYDIQRLMQPVKIRQFRQKAQN